MEFKLPAFIPFFITAIALTMAAGCSQSDSASGSSGQSPQQKLAAEKAALGKKLFFDSKLSSPPGQACASCHDPATAFTDPDKNIPVSEGVIAGRFGNRNTPTAAYAAYSPEFHFDPGEGIYFGGQFLDGRASTLKDQAKAPLLNPVEMDNPDMATVVQKVSEADYADEFRAIYGQDIFLGTAQAYDSIADAIAAFERTSEVSPFSSKFDAFVAGKATLTAQEARGMDLFNRPDKGNCAACHPSTPDDPKVPALFTDFSYDNLGVPANPDSPFLTQDPQFNADGKGFVDFGLGGELAAVAENGKFKVPTLRNIAVTGPYMHNGVFSTLEQVLHFYSDRDADMVVPEVADNVNRQELGALNLTDQEQADIIAFLKTLTDGYSE